MDEAAKVELEALELVKPIDEAAAPGDSEIQLFYRGATVFITGGTGFIGKQLTEKLFRSCDIKKAYILIRPKHDKSVKDRLQEMLQDPVFGPVRAKNPDLETRLAGVKGDLADIQLGICDADWKTLTEEVGIIFHVAATVRLGENIQTATLINVRGTREALKLGRACKKLRSFVHVSTAYCNAKTTHVGSDIKEIFYPSPILPQTMITLAETVDRERLDLITPSLTQNWPNAYTFTKAIAEELVKNEAGDLPVCVVRPSIVLCSYREPVPGWLDRSCVYGPSGLCLGVGVGVLRVLYVDNKRKLSFVPVDFVNNATISAAWETAVRRNNEIKIYHISSTNCGVTIKHVSNPLNSPKNRSLATTKSMWYCFLLETNNRYLFFILSWILHYIPAYFIDGIMKVFNLKKPKELKSFVGIYTKIDKMASLFSFFLTNEWNFDDSNLTSLWQKMSRTDRKIFNFDIEKIDWDHNGIMWYIGLRKYLIKDGLKHTARGVLYQKCFRLAHYMLIVFYLWIFWKILNWFSYIVKLIVF